MHSSTFLDSTNSTANPLVDCLGDELAQFAGVHHYEST